MIPVRHQHRLGCIAHPACQTNTWGEPQIQSISRRCTQEGG
jgi:hypothetical protein